VLDLTKSGDLLVADMSTDFLTHAIDWRKYSVVFADAAHNVGPSGCTIVVVRSNLLKRARTNTPASLKWRSSESAAPCSAVFMCSVAFDYMMTLGGVYEMEARAKARAEMVYRYIDDS
jgi:phosphoserine aminotransferase